MEQIRILPGRSKPFFHRHSWVFSGAVASYSRKASVGIAEVLDEKGNVLGYGFSDPESQIVCRLFHFGPKPESGFNFDYWKGRFENALFIRNQWIAGNETNTFRLLHAEGDEFPGLIADVYGGNVVVLNTLIDATRQWLETWIKIIQELGFERVFHRHGAEKKGRWYPEAPSAPVEALEHGIRFRIEIETGQKTGFFIDQRENRKRIGAFSQGRKVLNAFGFTGGFSLYALAGGAREVVTLDISKEACSVAELNVALNGFPEVRHRSVTADCFDYLKEMDPDFDLIVLDPPAFAKSRSAVEKAARGYKEINLSAFRKIASGGLLATFSCSQHIDSILFRKIVAGAAVDAGRKVRILEHFHQPADHPVSLFHPEGEYLKGLFLLVD